jgi:hypothetical protein
VALDDWFSVGLRWLSEKPSLTVFAVIGILILCGLLGSSDSTKSPSTDGSYTPPTTPSTPAYTPPSVPSGASSAGNVYRVPSSISGTLRSEKAEIESERAGLESLEVQVETLGREIERDHLYLDRTSESAVDEFNAKAHRYNTLVNQAKTANAAFNEKVNNYNSKLRQYGR